MSEYTLSPAYQARWNDNEQARIDADIEKHRKADATVALDGVAPGTPVDVKLVKHGFFFGAHLFNFDQLGSDERNRRHQALYGTLFNSATVPFYWKKFELEEGHPRFAAEYRDTAEYWNTVPDPEAEPHWRRPATDPLVDFCERKGLRIHGHPLTWGNATWHYPEWLARKLPPPYNGRIRDLHSNKDGDHHLRDVFEPFTPEQLEKMFPGYMRELNHRVAQRIVDIALHYRGRVHSWDVVNESAGDFNNGMMRPGSGLCKSWYGLMPGDYTYRSFKVADSVFPKDVWLNINDFNLGQGYVDQVADLRARGCKIDVMGAQMHLFNPKDCLDIAEGTSTIQCPDEVRATMARLAQADLPIHLSEITITSPTADARGETIQATIARNLYRLWFSIEKMNGITWWNVVDGCGAPAEPGCSGLFTRDMEPKRAYTALMELIHREWTTKTRVAADAKGAIAFRGFRGDYQLAWTGADGTSRTRMYTLQ